MFSTTHGDVILAQAIRRVGDYHGQAETRYSDETEFTLMPIFIPFPPMLSNFYSIRPVVRRDIRFIEASAQSNRVQKHCLPRADFRNSAKALSEIEFFRCCSLPFGRYPWVFL